MEAIFNKIKNYIQNSKNRGIGLVFFSLKVKNSIPRNRVRQQSKTITVEATIFAFGFSKKYDISLLSIECRVLDRCRAFDRLACVDAHLCSGKLIIKNWIRMQWNALMS